MRIYVFALIAFIILSAGSCNTEHIEGYIEYNRDEISVSDSLFLKAIVTSDTEPYDVLWDFLPSNSEVNLLSPVPGDTSNSKYNAVFVASQPGEYTVSVRFLYKNTNPKESDSILVKVID